MSRFRLIILFVILLFINQVLYGQENERWYVVSLGGNPVGYTLEKNEISGDEKKFLTEVNISIGRLGSSVAMKITTFQYESEGRLLGIDTEMNISNDHKTESMKVMDDHLIIESPEFNRQLPLDRELTGPNRLLEKLGHEIENNNESIQYTTYSGDLGMYLNGKIDFIGSEEIELNGQVFNAVVVEESFKELPIIRKKWLTKNGLLLKSTEPGPFGEMELALTDKENVLSALNNSVDLSEEQYGNSMAYANYRLSHPRNLTSAKIKITQRRPELGFPDFTGEYQKIISKSDTDLVLQIDKPELYLGQNKSENLDEYLEPNHLLDNSDALLISQTKEVIGEQTDDWEKAKLIIDWVANNMIFDAGIVLADSREVIRDLKGTCVSYAMLTATMCKAAGIPARYLMGYVYVDGAWGGHAWAEVNIKGQWIPIDAAVPNDTNIADAARFFMFRSSLMDGMGIANSAGLQLFGNIEVEMLAYAMDGKTKSTTDIPYFIKDKTYINPGLKFSMEKLQGFSFLDLDKFYPENIILKQSNELSEVLVNHWTYGTTIDAEGSIKRILQKSGNQENPLPINKGRFEGLKVTGPDKSIAILKVDTKSFFTLTTSGKEHADLLEKALEAINIQSTEL